MLNLVSDLVILNKATARNRRLQITVRLHLDLMLVSLRHILILLILLEFEILLVVGLLLLVDPLHLVDELTLAHVLIVSLWLTVLASWLVEVVLLVYGAKAECSMVLLPCVAHGSEQIILLSRHLRSIWHRRIGSFGGILLVFRLRNIVQGLAGKLLLVSLSAFELVGANRVVRHHGTIAVNFELLVDVAILGRDAVLDVQLLELRPVVVRLQAQHQVLRAVEVELLLLRVLHRQVIPADLDLVEFARVDQHLAFGLFQETLHILRLQAVVQVLILGGDRLLGSERVHGGGQPEGRVQKELLAHDAVNVDIDVLDVELALVALLAPLAAGVGPAFGGGGRRAPVAAEVGDFVVLTLFAVLTPLLAQSPNLRPLVDSLRLHLLNDDLGLVLVGLLPLEILQLLGLSLDLLTRVLTLF